ncbi:hypothetical protein EZV62_005248 [Acer yangbiense]|uniref:UDP-glycosyltransferases domain-containing protein n=1 Tax=Acer yangbiense TaxID=1000413 RepID=A0A5C7ILY2_9ROSI|nr:hypothetical protein EZV62_005248 [Acer yangbiense]
MPRAMLVAAVALRTWLARQGRVGTLAHPRTKPYEPASQIVLPDFIPQYSNSPHLRQHFTALLHRLLSPTGKRIVIIHEVLMASIVQDSISIPNTESYAFNTVSAFFSFFDLWEALGKPFQIEVEVVPNELPSLEDKADIFTKECRRSAKRLEGFEKRTKGRGMIVRDWTPQLEILGHPSTGGFMSQYGWNSCLESPSMGVPIVAWPMHSDQPKNAVLISEVLRVGVLVKKWTHRGNC